MKTIVTIPCRTIKAMAREMLKGRYLGCVLIVLACKLLGDAPNLIAEALTENEYILLLVEGASFVFEVSLTLCLTAYYLAVFRGQTADLDGFTRPMTLTWKGVVMEIISQIQILLWSLLFIVPGIICAIKHAQNFRVMIDNPEFYPMECIHRSHEIMEGNKWKYVKLTLSFAGWMILLNAPLSIYTAMYGPTLDYMYLSASGDFMQMMEVFQEYAERMHAFSVQPIPYALSLLTVFLTAYMAIAYAAFYDLAAGNLIIQGEGADGFSYR